MADPHSQDFKPAPGNQATNGATSAGASAETSGGGRQGRVQFNDANAQTLYANAFRTNLGNNEVFLDLGINRFLGEQKSDDANAPVGSFRFDVSHRVAMNIQTAKQLAQHLTQVVAQLEQRAAPAQPPA